MDWQHHLRALQHEDLYVLVMVQAAGISGAPTGLAAPPPWWKAVLGIDVICLGVAGFAGVLVFFTPLGTFLRTDLIRGGAFLFWLLTLWALGAWNKRRTFRTRR